MYIERKGKESLFLEYKNSRKESLKRGGAASREKVMERLSIPAGKFTRRASFIQDKKRVLKSDFQTRSKEKKRRQAEQLRRTRREEALREAEGITYESGAF